MKTHHYKTTLAALTLLLITGCGSGGSSDNNDDTQITFSTKETLGEALFFDANLSQNRTQSCAGCHNPEHAFVDDRVLSHFSSYEANGTAIPVSLGDMIDTELLTDNLGERNAPTAAYAMFSPAFHYDETAGSYRGGQFHDGRETDLKGQAGGPPTNPVEMGMATQGDVVARIKENPDYVTAFKTHYGSDIFDDNDTAYAAMAQAIGKFEKTDTFAPFDSKYDRYLECKDSGGRESECLEAWSISEVNGMSLFFQNDKTNCLNCHTLASSPSQASRETFTNYEYHNIGVPKNPALTHLAGDFVDYGLYNNPTVDDETHKGKFKVPTLRNIAVTAPYMHNGVFMDLETVLKFYEFRRDSATWPINPETGEPWDAAEVEATIDTTHLKSGVRLKESQIRDIVAFLKTLTDKRYEHLLEE
jgi:cytochrome c peroxidase